MVLLLLLLPSTKKIPKLFLAGIHFWQRIQNEIWGRKRDGNVRQRKQGRGERGNGLIQSDSHSGICLRFFTQTNNVTGGMINNIHQWGGCEGNWQTNISIIAIVHLLIHLVDTFLYISMKAQCIRIWIIVVAFTYSHVFYFYMKVINGKP